MSYLPPLLVTDYLTLTQHDLPLRAWDSWTGIMQQLPPCHPTTGPWIAGGCVRRFLLKEDPWSADIDYFCTDQKQFNTIYQTLDALDARLVTSTEHHSTFVLDYPKGAESLTIQVIKTRFSPSLNRHLEHFDFSICQTGWNGEHFVVSR